MDNAGLLLKGETSFYMSSFFSPSLLLRVLEFNQLTDLRHVHLKIGYMGGNKSDSNLLSVSANYITKELTKK